MEIGALFILLIVLVVVGGLGGGLYLLIMWLRGRQLSPEGDQVEPAPEEARRPEHLRVASEQHTHFTGTR